MGRSRASSDPTQSAADAATEAGAAADSGGTASRGTWYTVRRGDTLSHIADEHGLASWRQIYDAPENEEFRRTHPDPDLIYPGDRVFVPDPNQKTETVPTTDRTRFRVTGSGVRLRFIFDNGDDNPNNDRELTYLCVSNLVTTDNLPEDFGPNAEGSDDVDHFKVEIEDPHERADTIPADKVTLEALKPRADGDAPRGTWYTVRSGDTLSGIAQEHGLDSWRQIYYAPENEEFRRTRPDPDLIYPGDRVFVPDPNQDAVPADRMEYASFSPERKLQIELQRVNDERGQPTNKFRSRYLRLVTDTVDQNTNTDQCLLADWDSSETTLEILDQMVQVEYRRDEGDRPKARIPIGHDRKRIRMAVHVLRRAPGGNPIVQVSDAEKRVNKWYRRTYAQANLAPKLVAAIDDVDPPRNMLVVSDNSGANAAGNANNRMRFHVRGSASGITYTLQGGDDQARITTDHDISDWNAVWNHAENADLRTQRGNASSLRVGDELYIPASGGRVWVVYRPPRGQTPIRTAQALAQRVRTAGYTANAFQNQARPGDPRGSADLVIKESDGSLVTLEDEDSDDNAQSLTVARVSTPNFEVSSNDAAGGFATHNIGSAMQRALVRNYRTADDRVECFVAGTVQYDNDAAHQIRGRAVSPKRFRPVAERPRSPLLRSTYMANMTMDATDDSSAGDSADRNPFTFPHESGHVIIDCYHAQENRQLMRSGTSGTNEVEGSKRIFDSAVEFGHMAGVSPFNQVSRLRSSGAPVLEDWSST
jgi:nucleoid-associated protein YgaU